MSLEVVRSEMWAEQDNHFDDVVHQYTLEDISDPVGNNAESEQHFLFGHRRVNNKHKYPIQRFKITSVTAQKIIDFIRKK